LDLLRRELAVVAQVAILGAERQLHSHLRGALNVGGEAAVVEAALVLALEDAGAEETKMARALWQRIRS
jgi:4-carboxymuconolactone decarboxylase